MDRLRSTTNWNNLIQANVILAELIQGALYILCEVIRILFKALPLNCTGHIWARSRRAREPFTFFSMSDTAKGRKSKKAKKKSHKELEEPAALREASADGESEETSSDEDSKMDYTLIVKMLKKQKKVLEKTLQGAMSQEDSAGNQSDIEKLLNKIASKERAISNALAQLVAPSRTVTPTRARSASKLPSNLPKWRSSAKTTKADCVKYLTKLEDAFNSEMFPEIENGMNRWVGALLTTMSESDEADWVRTTLTQQNVNWQECKRLFTLRFTRVVNFLAPARELKTIKKGSRSLASHSESFTRTMKEALLRVDGKSGVSYSEAQTEPIYSLIFVESLNESLAKAILKDKRMQEVTDLDTLLALASLVEQENATGEFYDSLGSASSSSLPHASKPRKHIASSALLQRAMRHPPDLLSRRRCGRLGHKEKECYSKVHKNGAALEKSAEPPKSRASSTKSNSNPGTAKAKA